jgi:hypothetical protein
MNEKQTWGINFCPITNNLPTTMDRKSFKRLCKFYKNGEKKPWSYKTVRNIYEDYCKKCGGKYPPDLTIINNNGMIED